MWKEVLHLHEFLLAEVTRLKQTGLYRKMDVFEPAAAVRVHCGGRNCLMFASNNYLGLTHHPAVKEAAVAATMAFGTGSGGARLTVGNHLLYDRLEDALAGFKATEAALVFGSGFLANIGVISALIGAEGVVFSDELNHASIIDGCRLARARVLTYRHRDTRDLAAKLAAVGCGGPRLIITDGVFSMDGDIAPLDVIVDLAKRHNALVMVDDAHATGVIGPGGRGTAAYYGVEEQVHIQAGTLSKALAAEGGFIAGSALLVEYLRNKARSFIFSTALAPAVVAAAHTALQLLAADASIIAGLRENTLFLRQSLREAGLKVADGETPIIPVIVGDAAKTVELAGRLYAEGIIVSAVRPPSVPEGTSRLRITVSAAHTRDELAAAARLIVRAAKTLGIGEES